jgi:outer membrane protein TolC
VSARFWLSPILLGLVASPALAQERQVAAPAAVAAAVAQPAEQSPDAMLIDEAKVVSLALADHPHIEAAEAERDSAEAAMKGARRALVPDVQLTGRYTRLSSIPAQYRSFDGLVFPQLLDNYGARAQVIVPLSELFTNLAASARALGHSADASALEVLHARAQIAYEARAAFLGYWRSTLALSTAIELTRAAESQVKDQRARQEAGTVARNDVLTFEVALDAAVMSEQTARAALASAEAMLRSFFPQLEKRELRVPQLPTTDADEPAPVAPHAVSAPPQIASLQAQAQAARERAKSASLNRLPKVSLVGVGDLSAPSPRVFVLRELKLIPTWEAGARVEWSLSQLTSGSSIAQREKAQHRAFAARVEEAQRKLDAERKSAVSNLTYAHERAQRASQRVEHAAALAAARRGELEAGTALPLNVVLAETDLARAKNEHVDAVVERAMALAKLDFIDGRTEPTAAGNGGAP